VIRHVSATAAVALFCCVGAAIAAKPSDDDVTQLTTTLPTLHPGQTAWVSTLWRGASVDATSFQMLADAPNGTTVSYPENTPGYSSLYKQSTLLADDTDYAAIKLQVGDKAVGDQTIRLTVTYCLENGGKCNNNGNGGDHVKRKLDVTLPVVEATGPTVEQVTTSVGPIKAGSAEFVSVSYTANKPGVTNARLTATPPAGATVIYPGERTSSGLSSDPDLSVGETDSASFKIDTGTLKPGGYQVGVNLAYGAGQDLPGSVTLTVN
jgi:hypothetical protein